MMKTEIIPPERISMKLTPTWTNVLIGMTSAIFSLCVDLDTPSNVLISCYTLLKIFKGTLNDFSINDSAMSHF